MAICYGTLTLANLGHPQEREKLVHVESDEIGNSHRSNEWAARWWCWFRFRLAICKRADNATAAAHNETRTDLERDFAVIVKSP